MRLTKSRYYQIDGMRLSPVARDAADDSGLAGLRARQADLWAESSIIAHQHRTLTDEERGLWYSMWRELDLIKTEIDKTDKAQPGA
jgi:hypothetical protein